MKSHGLSRNACLGRLHRVVSVVAAATTLALPACRTMPDALTSPASRNERALQETTDDQRTNSKSVRQSTPQILGVSTSKPVVGETLPVVPRDCGPNGPPPLPYAVNGTWSPPGLKTPWPYDEYLHDGGDAEEPVGVSPEWRVEGLNVEDTVAHYDTLDGRTLVEASNCAYVYAPRFSSVRTVSNVVSNEMIDGATGFRKPERIVRFEENARVGTKTEQLQPVGHVGNLKPGLFLGDQRGSVDSYALLPSNAQQALSSYEDLSVIRRGVMQGSEKARLAEAAENAIVWTKNDGVRVYLDRQKAVTHTGDQRAQAIYVITEPTCARLRIVKVASTAAAQPGDVIDFTLRYDNVGDQTIGNVVILDSLTTRLEYVADSAQSSRKARFTTSVNPADSLELRWEIDEPLEPGDGGVVRFRCRVR